MLRRVPTLLLAALVVLTSVALGTCPMGRCASMQADAAPRAAASEPQQHDHAAMHHDAHAGHHADRGAHAGHHADRGAHAGHHADHGARQATNASSGAHDCCARDGIGAPRCCPDTTQLAQHEAPASVERASAGIALVATQSVPASLAAFPTATTDPPRAAPPGRPPGTLIAQHTSLVV